MNDTAFRIALLISEPSTAQRITGALNQPGRQIVALDGPAAALQLLRRGSVDLLVVDSAIPRQGLVQISSALRERGRPFLLLIGDGELAVTPDEVLPQPLDLGRLERSASHFQQKLILLADCPLLGRSEAIQGVIQMILQIAPTNVSILLTGESGTGKDLAARTIHRLSPRSEKPFIPVNCGALPKDLIESELFGHEKGAFTGADARRRGMFETASGGTILLDEIGEMPAMAQVKLLRVLDDREFMRVGGSEAIRVDVRVIAATNRDLRKAASLGEFRRDLYYRLKVVEIVMPPLRERREDIPLLAEEFARRYCRENSISFAGMTDAALRAVSDYSWPGNVRELKHTIESAIALAPTRKIDLDDVYAHLEEADAAQLSSRLPVLVRAPSEPSASDRELLYRILLELKAELTDLKHFLMMHPALQVREPGAAEPRDVGPYHPEEILYTDTEAPDGQGKNPLGGKTMLDIEHEAIQLALQNAGGNRKKAASALGIGERTIYRKLKDYGAT